MDTYPGGTESMDCVDVPQSMPPAAKDSQLEKQKPAYTERSLQPAHTLSLQSASSSMPNKKGNRVYRYVRWNIGSVYRRVFSLVFAANAVALAVAIVHTTRSRSPLTYQLASDAVAANLLTGLAVRNEHVVNVLFIVFGTWPRHLPLPLRRLLAKIYSYGGIHSGCGVAATVWYIAFLTQLTRSYVKEVLNPYRCYIVFVSYGIVVLLVTILVFAHPSLRVHLHNWFECTHRFFGWTVVILFYDPNLGAIRPILLHNTMPLLFRENSGLFRLGSGSAQVRLTLA